MTITLRKPNWKSLQVYLIYFILLAAFLNPVLRPSAGSNITLFRLMLPLALLLIVLCSTRLFLYFAAAVVVLCAVSGLQYFWTARWFYPGVDFSLSYFATYLFHYGSLLIVFFLVLCLKKLEGEHFAERLCRFACLYAKALCLFLLVYTGVLGKTVKDLPLSDNINNLCCVLCASACTFLVERKGWWRFWFWMVLFLFIMYINDSKAALFGLLFELVIVVSVRVGLRLEGRGGVVFRSFVVLMTVFAIAALLIVSPSIHGYSLRALISDPIRRILTQDLFPRADTSITYRTNSTAAAFEIIQRTFGLGVGAGNTARVLKAVMVNVYPSWDSSAGYSLHNWWLELMTDFGLPLILGELYLFLREIRRYLLRIRFSELDLVCMAFLISFPIWSISASGLVTEYYTLTVLSFVLLLAFSSSHDHFPVCTGSSSA